ncbi:MAG: LexA family transcriptional regulator [Campylobacter sp.]
MMYYDDVVAMLKELTGTKTIKELSQKLEINQRNFNTWKTRGEIPIKTLATLALKLGVSMEQLTGAVAMSAREKLNELKNLWGFKTDNELAEFLGVTKFALDNWVKRDKISNEWLLKIGQMTDNKTNSSDTDLYFIRKITSIKASAGGGNELDGIKVYDTGEIMPISKAFFKVPPNKNVCSIQVDGESMMPILKPGDWVIFYEDGNFKGDGLYVLNFSGQLMVKILQLTPQGMLKIISANKDFQSYEVNLNDSQESCVLVGKVIKSLV